MCYCIIISFTTAGPAGVGHASAMFKRGIRICTGTGIGATLSTCIQSKDWYDLPVSPVGRKTLPNRARKVSHLDWL